MIWQPGQEADHKCLGSQSFYILTTCELTVVWSSLSWPLCCSQAVKNVSDKRSKPKTFSAINISCILAYVQINCMIVISKGQAQQLNPVHILTTQSFDIVYRRRVLTHDRLPPNSQIIVYLLNSIGVRILKGKFCIWRFSTWVLLRFYENNRRRIKWT